MQFFDDKLADLQGMTEFALIKWRTKSLLADIWRTVKRRIYRAALRQEAEFISRFAECGGILGLRL